MFSDRRITHFVEPQRLFLAWNEQGMSRHVVGELVRAENELVTLRYFPESNNFKNAEKAGFTPIPAFRRADREYSNNVMDFFMSRITSRKRSDFELYLQTLGIAPEYKDTISDFALLGYGEGRLPSDGYHVVNAYSDIDPPVEFVTEVAGLSYGSFTHRMDNITPGQKVTFCLEPHNPQDENAVRIDMNNEKLGYINRIQAPSVKRWLDHGSTIQGEVFRKNGLPSAPRIFVFLEARV